MINRRKINVYRIFRLLAFSLLAILIILILIFSFVDFTEYVETSGYLRPSEYHIIRAKTNGFIDNVYFEDGDNIEKDQLLIELDTKELELNLNSINNQIKYLELDIERLKEYIDLTEKKFKVDKEKEEYNLEKSEVLLKTGSITKFQYETMKYEYDSFIISYQISKSDLTSLLNNNALELKRLLNDKAKYELIIDKSSIYSPSNGQIIDKSYTPLEGAYVTNGQEICFLYEDSEIIAEILIPESQMGKVSIGQEVELDINAYPIEEYDMFEGELTYISSDSNDGYYTGGVSLKSDIVNVKTENDIEEEKKLLYGLGLKAKIKIGKGSIFDILFKSE